MKPEDYPRLIGLTGRAGSGKTEVANWMSRNFGNNLPRISFATPLKMMTQALVNATLPKTWPHTAAEYTTNPDLKETPLPFLNNVTPRHIMQTLGTEWGREVMGQDFWVAIAAMKVERLLGHYGHVNRPVIAVFDDVRFGNEAEMIRAYDGIVVEVVRAETGKPREITAHASERLGFPVDLTLPNDGTLEDLYARLAELWPPYTATHNRPAREA
jgi:hypothetical protein